ncbi:AAA family ATPase [Rhodovulum sulfidophilum]|uniref:AAA family ATPase n=1 Tax=Rhodovulum sulfidophilum TaxID=35806 RepID=UPI00192729EF|nr:AAA family ATPase [Rhodovulum sulfidophilum]MBL3587496.1 AAA family ATPase [Rhodovulum sulfidophilum]
MRLIKARVQSYRSIRDTDEFDVELLKTIMVGPNEAGKSAILQALQQTNRPEGVSGFDSLRDYPRKLLNKIDQGEVDPRDIPVTTVWFSVEEDIADLPESVQAEGLQYTRTCYLNNRVTHRLVGLPDGKKYSDLENDLLRLAKHLDSQVETESDGELPSKTLEAIVSGWRQHFLINEGRAALLEAWLKKAITLIDEDNAKENERLKRLRVMIQEPVDRSLALEILDQRTPKFVLFSNYFRVRPIIHLAKLAQRVASDVLEDDGYDYGNMCLLKLLGLNADELSKLGMAGLAPNGQIVELDTFRDELDKRDYRLNSASIMLTDSIREVWNPSPRRAEADRLRIKADGQYLKVVVEDELGVEVELDQRSEGFQWLVSFFVVFFAEAQDEHDNAILLLDEPGLHLHGLKQRDFRETVSKLAAKNQTIFTTHSPFLVGPNELDLVRVVSMTDRNAGTKVHTSVTANDPAALLPLQEALGYDLAQSLFAQKRNLVLEGLTDYWYFDAVSELLREAGVANLNQKIAMVPANTAGKVVYFATILHAQGLKVVALLDSDNAGNQAAEQDTLVHTLGNKAILRTKDFLEAGVKASEVEDLLRDALVSIAKSELGWDVSEIAEQQEKRSIVSIFEGEIKDFSKYRLAKAFVKWSRDHEAKDLSEKERSQWARLIAAVNAALK